MSQCPTTADMRNKDYVSFACSATANLCIDASATNQIKLQDNPHRPGQQTSVANWQLVTLTYHIKATHIVLHLYHTRIPPPESCGFQFFTKKIINGTSHWSLYTKVFTRIQIQLLDCDDILTSTPRSRKPGGTLKTEMLSNAPTANKQPPMNKFRESSNPFAKSPYKTATSTADSDFGIAKLAQKCKTNK